MNLPYEIIENILYWCSGRVLLRAHEIHPDWHEIVEKLTKVSCRKPIWKWCCHEEIPENELIEYLEKYAHPLDPNKWLYIYKNWCSWQNLKSEVDMEIYLSRPEIPRITCIAVFGWGDCIAVGSEDGRIRCFNGHWEMLFMQRHYSCRVNQINFIYDDESDFNEKDICMLVAYKRQLVLVECENVMEQLPLTLFDVKSHSVYKKYICYEQLGGRITISKLLKDSETGLNYLQEITFVRIYSPEEVTCFSMWDNVCTFLLGNQLKTIKYSDGVPPMTNLKNKITFCIANSNKVPKNCFIYRNSIIIGLTEGIGKGQFIELFILNNNDSEYSQKLFNVWEVLYSLITCMFLYGSTFVIGVYSGCVYFYNVSSWKSFDLRNYQRKVIVGQHPIIDIDVKESFDTRKFYVTSTFNIHEIAGYSEAVNFNH